MNLTRHLASDEIVERVFPSDDRSVSVPEHLAHCGECQERVANLREAWLLDRGAVSGAVDDLPDAFWDEQAARTMVEVRTREENGATGEAPAASALLAFPGRARGIVRHPILAFSSLAAALLLVGGLSLVSSRTHVSTPALQTAAVRTPEKSPALASDASDDELLVSVDRVLEDSSFGGLVVEDTL